MNTERPEPLAAVLAEMRDFADHRAADAGGERPGIELLRSYADRIEAAAERERNAHTNDIHDALYKATGIPGNAAALREALQNLCDCTSCDWACIGQTNYDQCDETCLKCTGRPERDNDCPWIQARAALAAPARNCDVCRTLEDADFAYANRKTTGLRFSSYADFEAWIFAPAKGGGK